MSNNLINEKIENLIKLYKEMLDYKNKSYEDNWDLEKFTSKISQYYNFFHNDVYEVLEMTIAYSGKYTEEEIIETIDSLYYQLTDPKHDYKHFANYYKDFDLKEGQTFHDLIEEEKEKFSELFKEILDFLNVSYDKNEPYWRLKYLVIENYPYYDEMLRRNLSMQRLEESYVSILHHMELIYDNLKNTYKNYDENMKKYNEEQEKINAELDFFITDDE